MLSKPYTTKQGVMWDQISLARYDSEMGMQEIARANLAELDALMLSGDMTVTVPETQTVSPRRQLPPWERM